MTAFGADRTSAGTKKRRVLCALGSAGETALRSIQEMLLLEEVLLVRCEAELLLTINTSQHQIDEIHRNHQNQTQVRSYRQIGR